MGCGCRGSNRGVAARGAATVRPTLVLPNGEEKQYATIGEAQTAQAAAGGGRIEWRPPAGQ